MNPAASIVIPTRNRVAELRGLLESLFSQTVKLEVLVMDDGDSDALAELIRTEFPQVTHHRLGHGRGPAFQRNRGIERAKCPVVFPVDDDTLFVSPRTVEQTLADFDHPRIGAVGIPFINVRQNGVVHQKAAATGIFVAHAYVGAAHAVRREVFLDLGGYREHFFYMGEEGDLCVRLMNNGFVVRMGQADPIHHLESATRNLGLAGYCGRRNDIFFAWHNVPLSWLPVHLIGTTLKGVRSGLGSKCFLRMMTGTLSAYRDCLLGERRREPVSVGVYLLHRRLKKRGPQRLDRIHHQLPPLSQPQTK